MKLKSLSWNKIIKDLFIFAVLILIILIFTLLSAKFLRVQNITNLLRNSAPIIFVSSSLTLLMISGHVDLSVGGILSLSACTYAVLLQRGVPYLWAILAVLAMGCLMGLINGFLVVKLKIVPVISTLATMNFFWGLARLMVPAKKDLIKEGLPKDIDNFARQDFLFGIPLSFYVAIIGVIILVILQRKTILGKYAAAIGGNSTSASLSGINVALTVQSLYVIVAFFSAVAGLTRASYMKAGDPKAGIGMELDAIVAVLLGGTSFFGGSGSVLKTVVAAFVLICLTVGMSVIGTEPYWQTLIKGIVLIVALIINHQLTEKVKD